MSATTSPQRNSSARLRYRLLDEVPHATLLRTGGESEGPYSSLNLSFEVGDKEEAVAENRRKAFSFLGAETIHEMRQIHGNCVRLVDERSPALLSDCDALLTQTPGRALLVKHADCQAALFFDPVQRAIAAVHCGWRGSVCNLYASTIAEMQKQFRTRAADLLVAISPSLGPQAAEFRNFREELPASFWCYGDERRHFDFWALSRDQLLAAGVQSQNIENLHLCTYSCPQDFFSYRRDGVTGRHGTLVMLP